MRGNRTSFARRIGSALAVGLAVIAALVVPIGATPPGDGIITTFAGGGTGGDGVAATAALLLAPQGIALDSGGNVYVASWFAVRRIDAVTGLITTVAGKGTQGAGGGEGDGGPATAAGLVEPTALTFDRSGNLYIVDGGECRVRKVDASSGIITTVAGAGGCGYIGDGGPAPASGLTFPLGVAADALGNIFIADTQAFVLRRIDAVTGLISTFAGSFITFGHTGDNGPASAALFGFPLRLAIDAAGNLFVLDVSDHAYVRRIDGATGIVTTVAGGGSGDGTSGPATGANLDSLQDIAIGRNGDLYVGDSTRVRVVDLATGTISVVAGGAAGGFAGDGGPSSAALLNGVCGLAIAGNGNIYLSDTGNDRVRKIIVPQTGVPTTIIDATTPQSVLDGLVTVTGNLLVNNARGLMALSLPNLVSVGGSFTVTGNANLASLSVPTLRSVVGDLTIALNPQLASIDLGALTSVGGAALIRDNALLVAVDLPVLGTVGSATTVSDNGSATSVSAPALSGSGSVTMVNNGSASTTLTSPTVTGGLTVTSNGGGSIGLGSPDVTGGLTVTSNGGGSISIGSPNVSGSLAVTSNGGGSISIGSPDVTGGLTVTSGGGGSISIGSPNASGAAGETTVWNAKVGGNFSVTGGNVTSVSSSTVGGSTTVVLTGAAATMTAALPAGTFTNDSVNFTITRVDAAALTTASTTLTATVAPLAAYRFDFAVPTLGSDATLTFTIDVGALGADAQTLLDALDAGNATLATLPDALGATWQTFPVCTAGALPTAGGCVAVERLDVAGNLLPAGSTAVPAQVRFTGIAGHFSTWGVAILSPDAIAPVFAGVPSAVAVEAAGPAGAAVTFATPTASDALSGSRPVTCLPASGSTFPLGSTDVTCAAEDAAHNHATAGFTVTVRDTRPPVFTGVPANTVVTAAAGATGAAVTWTTPTATDLVSGSRPVTCAPISGSTFPIGMTTVSCSATDAAGNMGSTAFTVAVQTAQTGGGSRALSATLVGSSLPDLDLFQLKGVKGERVTVRLTPGPAGSYTNGNAVLTILGSGVLQIDATAVPNAVAATLPATGTYLVTVSQPLRTSGRFSGAYTVSLESTLGAFATFVAK